MLHKITKASTLYKYYSVLSEEEQKKFNEQVEEERIKKLDPSTFCYHPKCDGGPCQGGHPYD